MNVTRAATPHQILSKNLSHIHMPSPYVRTRNTEGLMHVILTYDPDTLHICKAIVALRSHAQLTLSATFLKARIDFIGNFNTQYLE